MRILTAALVLTIAVVGADTAVADQKPRPLPADNRIKTFVYNEHTVYRLDMHTNFISTVQFARNEAVESIQIGDSASWQIIPLKRRDVISIKPLNTDAVTNMTVYTDKRVYTFELRAHRGTAGHRQNHNFRTTFQYPSATLSEFGPATSSRSGKNFDYFFAGEAAFSPIEVYDNGKQTFFRFPENAPLPGVFRVGDKGREFVVNSRTADSTIIVDGVQKLWTVRIGENAICVSNGPVVINSILGS